MTKQILNPSSKLKSKYKVYGSENFKLFGRKEFMTTYFKNELQKVLDLGIEFYFEDGEILSDKHVATKDNWQHHPYGNFIISFNKDNPKENNIKFYTLGSEPHEKFAQDQLKHLAFSIPTDKGDFPYKLDLWNKKDYPVLEVARNITLTSAERLDLKNHGTIELFSNPLIYFLRAYETSQIEGSDLLAFINCFDSNNIEKLFYNCDEDNSSYVELFRSILEADQAWLLSKLFEDYGLKMPESEEHKLELISIAETMNANKCHKYLEEIGCTGNYQSLNSLNHANELDPKVDTSFIPQESVDPKPRGEYTSLSSMGDKNPSGDVGFGDSGGAE